MGKFSSRTFRSGLLPGQTELEAGLSDTAWLNKLWEIEHDSIVNEKYFYSFRTKLFSTQLFSQVKLEDSLQANGFSDITLTVYERVPGRRITGSFLKRFTVLGFRFLLFTGIYSVLSTRLGLEPCLRKIARSYPSITLIPCFLEPAYRGYQRL